MNLNLFTGHKRLKFPLVKSKRNTFTKYTLTELSWQINIHDESKHSLNCLCIRKTINEKSTRMCELKLKFIVERFRAVLLLPLRVRPHFSSIMRRNENCLPEKFNERCTLDRVPITNAIAKRKKKKNSTTRWRSSREKHPNEIPCGVVSPLLSLPPPPFLPTQAFIPRKIISLLPFFVLSGVSWHW